MQEELKEVFDGSCDLIPISVVANYCKKLADEFIPELVETLASEMNPDTVCTVAGMLESVKLDKTTTLRYSLFDKENNHGLSSFVFLIYIFCLIMWCKNFPKII